MPVLRFCLDHHIKAAQLLLPLSAAFGHTSAGQVDICRCHNCHSSSGHSIAFERPAVAVKRSRGYLWLGIAVDASGAPLRD